MPYFMNVFDQSFVGSMVGSDRQYNVNYSIAPNINRTDCSVSWSSGPFNLSGGNNIFTINFSLLMGNNPQAEVYYSTVNVTLPNSTAVQATDVINSLNNDPVFPQWFEAFAFPNNNPNPSQIMIRSALDRLSMKFYISNSSAESVLNFNAKAPIKQLPSYYNRFSLENSGIYPDSIAQLLYLNPSVPTDAQKITASGQNPLVVLPDWELLKGRVEDYKFEINTFDGLGRVTLTTEFFAGASVADLGKRSYYEYIGSNTTPSAIFTVPYVLQYTDIANVPPGP